jgi:hypothetical protein
MAATFEVEDGTGKADANAYVAVPTVTQYAEDYLADASVWTGLAWGVQERHIRVATRYLDATLCNRWKGSRASQSQALDWPRKGVVDRSGFQLDSDALPAALKQACCQFVIEALSNDLLPNLDSAGRITRKREKLGDLEQEIQYEGGFDEGKVYQLAVALLDELLVPRGRAVRA